MSKRKVYHVVCEDNDWKVKLEKAERASGILDTKQQAIIMARKLAKAVPLGQVKIHKMDGKIETEYTYGEDPRKTPG